MATLLKADGMVSEVKPANGRKFTLEEVQKLVGGYVQMVDNGDGTRLLCNEDGKVHNLPPNAAATAIYKYGRQDHIVGDVVIVTRREF